MSAYVAPAATLIVGAVGPALWLASHGRPEQRLIGLLIGSPVVVLVLMLISEASAQSSSLIVPLVLALLSVAGTLVFTRLLAPQADDQSQQAEKPRGSKS